MVTLRAVPDAPSPSPADALRFLRWVRGAGPWVLTAIHPEPDRPTETRTFLPEGVDALSRWIAETNTERNVYWMVNRALGPLSKKAAKDDVGDMEFLHVDIDPPKGSELTSARAAILAKLSTFAPRPSAVVDSGGGYQAFWRLAEPLYVGGDPGRAAEAEAYNQQLGMMLGGDNTHNVDRVMRVPGTVNWPNPKKRAAGRLPTLARIEWVEDLVYPLGDFTAAPRMQPPGASGLSTASRVRVSGNLPPVLMDDLPERVTLRTKMLIVQGEDPDDPTRYGSRSDVVFAVACALIRAGCENDVIASILLDPDYAVSAHVLAQRRSVEYAERQIQRAREQVEEPLLLKLNDKHAVIEDMGGKCRVISEVVDHHFRRPRTRISKQSFEDFRNRYMHIRVQVGTTKDGAPVYKPAGAWWLGHEMRRQFVTLVFAPNREIPDAYNLWRGFACEAIPGRRHESLLAHVRDNVCGGNPELFDYFIRWMARAVQHPGEQGEVAVVLRGGRGTGKGTIINAFGSLWGRHFIQVSSAKHLVGQFNAHLRDVVVLFADEAFFAGDKQHESVLKTLITEDTLVVEGKGLDAEIGPNYTHLLMGSNENWVVPAGYDERRFFVLDVRESRKQDDEYFGAIREDLDNGGRESLLHYLLTLDLTGFRVRRVPQTDALQDQKMFSMGTEDQWWLERLMDGRTTAATPEWQTTVLKDRVHADYLRYAEGQRIMRRVSPTALGKFLARALPEGWPRSVQRMAEVEREGADGRIYTTRERAYFYELPSLEEARAAWNARYGGGFAWPKDETIGETRRFSDADPY